ncbi:armadillo-type protein [Zychaea mexicana]|uniref:armadillo-type protein n=1 Tax=Zychaea mexicana TaxID=64656 RepID=UPI0022FE4779|nr:armadillo-type protein [Zychaea mexicana]KAI9479491.1 armadillo-type protein [Zychaea mexicana]
MNSTQSPAQTNTKPALHGVKIKQRKGVQKAQAKHEPEVFRDQLLQQLNTVDKDNFDEITARLDAAGNTLEYRKYADSLFEILITGGIVEPGGIVSDNAERSSFSIFSAPEDAESIKQHVNVFNKVIRRYKYLQRSLEDTLKHVLQFINKWQFAENNKLAMATGYIITSQLTNVSILKVLLKDYLVKDGASLEFATSVFRTILSEQSIDQFGKMLINTGMDAKLIELFPPNKREEDCLARHFEAEDMKQLVGFHQKNLKDSIKDEFMVKLKDMMSEEAKPNEVATYVKQIMKENGLNEPEAIQIVWMSVLGTIDLINARPDQVEIQALRAIKGWAPVLEAFTSSPKTELVLLQKVQISCYEDAKLTKFFRQIVQVLYKHDVLSDNAIIFWADKAHKPQGKTVFLKQMEAFVKWLRENEDSSEEEDDE